VAMGPAEAMTLPLPFTGAETLSFAALAPALAFAGRVTAAVLGPGLSRHPETRAFTMAFVERCPVPLVVDADGLNNLADELRPLATSAAPRILTPHPGEMARLTGLSIAEVQADRERVAARFAVEHRCVVVLKGQGTVIAGPGGLYVNTTGNPGMATGGTGDVLAGLTGGLLAQGADPVGAAALGVWLHGLAGDFAAASKTGRAMLARDLVDALPDAWASAEGDDA
jgi:ADP-dependent NAD(P)H-hydrate dehydratase / NAD(P)H-hydrate epimerase